MRAAAKTDGPFYIRLSRANTPVIHHSDYQFKLGEAEVVRQGSDLAIVGTGVMVSVGLDAAELLEQEGISARVINVHTLSPIDEAAILAAARDTGAIVTAEEHLSHGGLGSIVAQVVGQGSPVPLEMVALRGYSESGTANELMAKAGLTAEAVRDAGQAGHPAKIAGTVLADFEFRTRKLQWPLGRSGPRFHAARPGWGFRRPGFVFGSAVNSGLLASFHLTSLPGVNAGLLLTHHRRFRIDPSW